MVLVYIHRSLLMEVLKLQEGTWEDQKKQQRDRKESLGLEERAIINKT